MSELRDMEARVSLSNVVDNRAISTKYCPNSRQTLRIAINLKELIDKVIPIIYDEYEVTKQSSSILNESVISLVYKAAGGKGNGEKGTSSYKYRSVLIFCLLRVCGWYWQQADLELSDNDLYKLRAVAAQTLAAIVIERTKDDEYLFLAMLCHRYVINLKEEDADPVSALELAVDMHSTIVIGTSGYQRCVKWLWQGWIVESSFDSHSYVFYKDVASHSVRAHFDPARIKTPLYQNILEIAFSVVFLVLFTIILNGHQLTTPNLDGFEVLFQLFTLGYIADELIKFYHVGWNYVGFFNLFNDCMYAIITVSIGFRYTSLNSSGHTKERYDEISFRLLSCAAPFLWTRFLLYLDAQKFVGAIIVVVKVMMRESFLFFFLLSFIVVGFLQGFLGLDASDGEINATQIILVSLVKSVIGGSSFDDFSKFVPPYASILYYIYEFLLSVILMNILIALYSSAYASIVNNATDEFLALVAQKTLRYIRAPDENTYVPPFNVIELLITPISWFTSKLIYKKLNYYIMLVVYSPMLVYITYYELGNARRIQYNRYKGYSDDANEFDTEWDLQDGYDVNSNSINGAITERNEEINQSLRDQYEGENQDPEFAIDIKEFEEKIEEAVQPVQIASKMGIPWEFYSLHLKIDKLTTLVEKVVQENTELKQKLKKIETKQENIPANMKNLHIT